jgi:hypothetical protein
MDCDEDSLITPLLAEKGKGPGRLEAKTREAWADWERKRG